MVLLNVFFQTIVDNISQLHKYILSTSSYLVNPIKFYFYEKILQLLRLQDLFYHSGIPVIVCFNL
jgi:hypothetical protein